MENFIKKSGWTGIITSIIFAILGIVLIVNPNGVLKFVSVILATIFIVFGIVKIMQYFTAKGNYNFYNYDFIYGIISIIVGIVTLCFLGTIETILRIIIGLWIIYSGIIRLDFSFKLKSMELKSWIPVIVLAILMMICGIVVIATKGALVSTIGIFILIYSIMDLIESIIFMKNVNDLF